jgi:protein phosphatase
MTVDPSSETAEFELPPMPSDAPRPVFAPAQVEVDALSHPGMIRTNNEDFYLVARTSRSFKTLLTNLPEGFLPIQFGEDGYGLAVADGMGGMAAGEVASRMAITTMVNLFAEAPYWIMRTEGAAGDKLMARIVDIYQGVNVSLSTEARINPHLAGMGTTLTLAYSLGRDLFVAHVGDSRAYLLRGTEWRQLTRDHTLAQSLADTGAISREEVGTHPQRHVLTRALGSNEEPIQVDVSRFLLNDGDQVLLCTDGLSDLVEDASITAAVREAETATAACQRLVELALKQGGRDNVTVLLARYRFGVQA